MKTRKTVLGEEHPDTLTSMANLAFTLEDQGRISEAISLLDTFLKIGKLVFGPEHPDILSSSEALHKWIQDYGLPDD
jgi:hypothetical protein